jgi:VanZ family protein
MGRVMPAGTTAADGHRSFSPVRALALGAAGAMALAVFVGAESAALVGVADERHQLGVVGRDASWQDAVADLLGALAAVASRRALVRRG